VQRTDRNLREKRANSRAEHQGLTAPVVRSEIKIIPQISVDPYRIQ
jgi:hypothetical protein